MSNPHIPFDPRSVDPLVLVEDQDRPLIWIGGEVLDAKSYHVGISDGVAASPRWGRILVAALVLVLVAFAAGRVSAAPRSGQTTERVDVSAPSSAALSGAPPAAPPSGSVATERPREPSGGAPLPSPAAAPDPSPATSGLASFVAPAFGSRYLALPAGRGIRVTICGPAGCVTRTSTDAGPDRAMQRAGRIADLSWADFRRICGCDPYLAGLVRVTVRAAGPAVTPPPTDVAP